MSNYYASCFYRIDFVAISSYIELPCLNKKLFIFGKTPSSLCSFYKQADETILHLFYKCNITKELWNSLDLFFNDCFHPPQLLPQMSFLDSLIRILITLYLKIMFFYFLNFICSTPECKKKLHEGNL